MKQTDGTSWQRTGSSIVWSPQMLGPLITDGVATPLRTVLGWMDDGFPESPPGDQNHVLVGGLQTVMETLLQQSPDVAYHWLRKNMMPLVRAAYAHWPRVGLIFGMSGPDRMFMHNQADDLVYFGRSRSREGRVSLTLGMWNGAAAGEGSFQLLVPGTKEIGGYYVQRVS